VKTSLRRYGVPAVGVAACLVGAVVAFLLAFDVWTVTTTLRDDDIRYRAAPAGDLWNPRQLVSHGVATAVLGVDDDLAYRRAVRAVRLSHPELPGYSEPTALDNRNEATTMLTRIVERDPSDARKSAAANLLGVLSFSDAIADYTNRERLLTSATSRFRQAIELDPGNRDAKLNLELTLSGSKALKLSEAGGGTNPTAGGKGAKGAGAGEAGSGY
jgi:hypothetical protein